MVHTSITTGIIKACCAEPQNLAWSQPRADLKVGTCRLCGCRHYHMYAEPGRLGLIGKEL